MRNGKGILAAGIFAAVLGGLSPRWARDVPAEERVPASETVSGYEPLARGSPTEAASVGTGGAGSAADRSDDPDISEGSAEELEEELDGDMSENDLDQLIEGYFSGIDAGTVGAEDVETDMVIDPPLVLEKEEDGGLRYTLPNGNYFLTTAPCGMVSSQPVDVFLSSGIVGVVRKDDVLDIMPDSWHFDEPGDYHIKMLSYQPAAGSSDDHSVYEVNHHFTIISGTDGRLGAIPAPEDFRIVGVRLGGQPLPIEDERCFFLEEDGRYEIQYRDWQGGDILLETVFVHDTTAPFLSFSKELEGKETEAPLEFYPSEPDCRVMLGYNGDKGYAVGNVLTAAGNYELCVEDAAGNRRSYHLRIRQTYDFMDARIILAGGVILAGLALWLVFLRRNMRVI